MMNIETVSERLESRAKNDIFELCKYGSVEQISQLIREGESINHEDEMTSMCPLTYACGFNTFKFVKLLIEHGADVNHRDKAGWSPLIIACSKNSKIVVKLLIDNGADVNQPTEDNWTALLAACHSNSCECVQILLQAGADVNHKYKNGWTALMEASCFNNADCVKLLLDYNADAKSRYAMEGRTALRLACQFKGPNCIQYLIDVSDINHTDRFGWSPLMTAYLFQDVHCIKALRDAGADPGKVTESSNTVSQTVQSFLDPEKFEDSFSYLLKSNNSFKRNCDITFVILIAFNILIQITDFSFDCIVVGATVWSNSSLLSDMKLAGNILWGPFILEMSLSLFLNAWVELKLQQHLEYYKLWLTRLGRNTNNLNLKIDSSNCLLCKPACLFHIGSSCLFHIWSCGCNCNYWKKCFVTDLEGFVKDRNQICISYPFLDYIHSHLVKQYDQIKTERLFFSQFANCENVLCGLKCCPKIIPIILQQSNSIVLDFDSDLSVITEIEMYCTYVAFTVSSIIFLIKVLNMYKLIKKKKKTCVMFETMEILEENYQLILNKSIIVQA